MRLEKKSVDKRSKMKVGMKKVRGGKRWTKWGLEEKKKRRREEEERRRREEKNVCRRNMITERTS